MTCPENIAGCNLWLDASSGVTKDGSTPAVDGDTIQQWNDRSSGAHNATQSTAGARPTYKTNIMNGQPVLRFNGAHNMATSSFLDASFNTNFTFFIVTTKVNTTIEATTSNQGAVWYSGGTNNIIANTQNLSPTQIAMSPPGSASTTNPTIETFKYNGARATLSFNGLPNFFPTTGNLGLSGALTIGSLSSNNFYYHGDMAEVILYNSALNDSQIGQIESYLATKYGITLLTPATPNPLFVFDGDSMTFGIGSTGGQTYPYQVQTLLGLTANYQNLGVSSQTVLNMSSDASTQIDPEYQGPGTTNIVTLLGGTNDLYFGADATTTYNRIVSYLQGRRTAGFKVIVNTILPRSGAATPSSFEADRQTINGLIRSNWTTFADGISDVASDSIIGPAGAELNTTYYTDKVHMTNTGYGVVASYVTAAIKQIMNPIAVSNVSVTPSTTTAAITWATNQTASTKVNYGLTSAYGSSTTETDTTTRVLSHTANLSSLVACTTYNFQAVSNDLNGNQVVSANQTFTTTGCLPTVSGVTSSTADGSYKAGQVVHVQINFSENVNVTGTPQLTLSTGSPATTAVDYTSGSGSSTLLFDYTVAAGNISADLDYAATTSLALNGGTIKNAESNDATLTLATPGAAGSLGANKNITIDTTAPNSPTAEITTSESTIARSSSSTPSPTQIIQTIQQNINTPLVSFALPSPHGFDSPFTFDASESFSSKGIVKYLWDFGDGATSGEIRVEHKYSSPGRYTVTLTVTDKSGKTATKEQTVDVIPPKPTIESISVDGDDLVIKGEAYQRTIVYLTIHSNPISDKTNADTNGTWSYKVANAKEALGTGGHTVLASASYVLADNTELKSETSKTYDFQVSLDEGKLKVEMKKTKTWQYVSLGLIVVIVAGFVLRRRRKLKLKIRS